MQYLNLALLALAAFPAMGHTEKVHGVVIYTRHGDRQSFYVPVSSHELLTISTGQSKVYKGYQVTRLGAEQVFNSGSFYRNRYIQSDAMYKINGISSDEYKPDQIWASAPDQSVRRSNSILSITR